MEIVVNDTNIFIDLHSIGVLDQFFESARPCEKTVKKNWSRKEYPTNSCIILEQVRMRACVDELQN